MKLVMTTSNHIALHDQNLQIRKNWKTLSCRQGLEKTFGRF